MQVAPVASTALIPGTYWQWQGHSIYYVKAGSQQSGVASERDDIE
jgi:hypothetical protein